MQFCSIFIEIRSKAYVPAEPQCLTQLSIAALLKRLAIDRLGDGQIAKERFPYQQQLDAETSHLLQTTRCHNLEMDGDVIDQVAPHIRGILRICSAVDLEGRELQEVNTLVGRIGKFILIQLSPVR
jgi:hypothetical protein